MTAKSDHDSVCNELDELAVKMLVLMKKYIDLKMTLEELVKTGSLHLAKSRYIMGNKSVSVLQLPSEDSELNATTKVVEKGGDGDQISFELARLSLSSPDGETSEGLKRRHLPDKKTEEKENKDNSGSRRQRREASQDPLKWFGVLVPQNMRLAQSSFNTAIETSIDIANVQVEMAGVETKYKNLLLKKTSYKEKSSEILSES